jgi:TfoX/Sxy family transcriptional regulator of competence genes
MATSVEFVEYICDQAEGTGAVRYRKMFGEYMVYVDDKPLFLVCDETAFVKMLPCVEELLKDAERGFPYHGAKEHYVLEVDNRNLVREVISALLPVTAVPKPRSKKKKADAQK